MSTRLTIGGVDSETVVGAESYRQSVQVFEECFDEAPAPLYIRIWQQGVFDNHEIQAVISREDALKLVADLAKWAASAGGPA